MKKKILVYAGIILFFLVLSYAFVPQVLGGKIVNQSDISGYVGMSHEMGEWNSAHPDDPTAWTGSMFSGMPTVTIHPSSRGDLTRYLYDLLLTGKRPASYLFISLLGAFLLLLSFGVSPLVAAGGAIAISFCSYNMQIIQVGHNTKMQAIAFLPWVLAAVVFTYRRALSPEKGKGWIRGAVAGAVLFAVALSFQIKANHPQISYYLAILILTYAIAVLIHILADRERRRSMTGNFFAASILLLLLGIAGIGTNASKLIPTWEYTSYSMRGGSADGSSKGLDLEYATAWSYGWEELPNLMIPNFNGGSSSGVVNPSKSETCKLLRRSGQKNIPRLAKSLPLYWGPQPFTAGPMYMGAVTVFLFLLGVFCYKGKEKWWLVFCTLFAVLLALGNHFMGFTKFAFSALPLYNRFRTVSMALTALQFTLPVLGFIVLDSIVKNDGMTEVFRRKGWIALALSGGFALLCILIPSVAGTFYAPGEEAGDLLSDALAADRKHLLVMDALRTFLFTGAAYLIILWGCSVPSSAAVTFKTNPSFGYSRRSTAVLLVCVLVLFDLFPAGKRYLNSDHFISPSKFGEQFSLRPVDKMILEDGDPSYRVLDLSVNVFNDSHPSYWHKNIGGYSPAKLKIYQSYIENHLSKELEQIYEVLKDVQTVEEAEKALPYLEGLAKLNCRYIILGADYPPLRYPFAKRNAWFETTLRGSSAPQDLAAGKAGGVVAAGALSSDGPGSSYVELVSYAPNELRYRYRAESESKAVFSEVWYPAGWTLTLADSGEQLEMELSDEVLRSAVLPAGEGELVMRFDPPSYRKGAAVSLASSILLLILLAGALLLWLGVKCKPVSSK